MTRELAGVVNVLKAPGISSHGVVARLRRIFGMRQIGHAGTLDPGAAGVLPAMIGQATKLMPYLVDHRKTYRAEMTLGFVTDSQDAAGRFVERNPDFSADVGRLDDVLASFVGEIAQVPPMVSALHHQGKRLYDLARAGIEVEREPRSVTIDSIRRVALWPSGSSRLRMGTRILLDVACSKGTYIRTLCHDIGGALGSGAYMSSLVRSEVGPYTLAGSHSLEELEQAATERRVSELVAPMESALAHMARLEVDPDEAFRLARGERRPIARDRIPRDVREDGLVYVAAPARGLTCIARVAEGDDQPVLQPVRVFA